MAKQRNPNGVGNFSKCSDGRFRFRKRVDGKLIEIKAQSMIELKEKIKNLSNVSPVAAKVTVSIWFDKWLSSYIEPLKKAATFQQYSILYRNHIKPIIGYKKITSVKASDVQFVIAQMHKKGLASKTMKHVKNIMNLSFSKALDEKMISVNPVQKIEIPVKQAKTRKVLSATELTKIFGAMENSRWKWSIHFLLVTGIRRGELLALKWSDIDIDSKVITIDESNSNNGLGDTKSSKVHFVPLSNQAIFFLHEQKNMLINEGLNISINSLVFPTAKGNMVQPNSFYHTLVRFAAKVDVKASPHCFRHTFVYHMRNKLSLKQLQLTLGHDESTTTTDIYGDVLNDTTLETASKIDDVFTDLNVEISKIQSQNKKDKLKLIK